MGLIHDHQIPRNRPQFILNPMGVVIGQHDYRALLERAGDPLAALLADLLRIENDGRQVKFLSQLSRPLLAQSSGTNHDDPAFAFSPVLAQHQPGFDGFAQANFISEHNAFGQRRPQRE